MNTQTSDTQFATSCASPFQPVGQIERIASIDVLRGVAVLGILLINVRYFGGHMRDMHNPAHPNGLTTVNLLVWLIGDLFFENKMIAIFSMLFGAGIVILTERADTRQSPLPMVFYRRLCWLLAFGLVHAYALWFGDILITYSICGAIVFLFRRRSATTLILLGVIVYSLFLILWQWADLFPTYVSPILLDWWFDRTPAPIRTSDAYHGSYWDLFRWRVWRNPGFHIRIGLSYSFWRCGGLMLLGMGLMKLGVFSASRGTRWYLRLMALGYGMGIPLVAYGILHTIAHNKHLVDFFGISVNPPLAKAAFMSGSVLVALGHVAAVMLICRNGDLSSIRASFAAVGRMALTNYLMQTVVCVIVFDGWAWDQWGRWSMAQEALLVIAIWFGHLLVSPLWLGRFRFGPMELLWRSLTYCKRLPIRR